ncbi:MAG: hypothetical protein ACI9CA_000355 [Natronomonas sp.]|jgi:hypothetical protein
MTADRAGDGGDGSPVPAARREGEDSTNPDNPDEHQPPVRADGGPVRATPERSADGPLFDHLSLRPGLLLGVVAFLGTYLVMYSLRAERVASAVAGLPLTLSTSTPEVTQVVGWLVYRAHFVPIKYSVTGAGRDSGVLSFGSFPGAGDLVRALEPGLLLPVPLVMLFICGFYTAIQCDVSTPKTGAVAGASVVVGYLLLVVVAVAALTWNLSLAVFNLTVTASIGPVEAQAVFLAGVVYPLVGGGVGGAVAGSVADWSPTG